MAGRNLRNVEEILRCAQNDLLSDLTVLLGEGLRLRQFSPFSNSKPKVEINQSSSSKRKSFEPLDATVAFSGDCTGVA